MSWHPVRMNLCACCGFDVARVVPSVGGFRGLCDPERGGCGAETDHAATEDQAVALWNNSSFAGAKLRHVEALRNAGGAMSCLDDIRYADLRPCACGCETPVRGWFGPPQTFYVHCHGCGAWLEGDTEDSLTMQWNRAAAAREAKVA